VSNPDDRTRFVGLCEFEALLWDDDDYRRYWPRFSTTGRCRRCGCTERRACRDYGRGCYWANDRATLCSRCAGFPDRRRFRRRRMGPEVAAALRAFARIPEILSCE
jgi:hypothetical protein